MTSDPAQVREHLRALYGHDNGGDCPGWLSIFAARGKDEQRETTCAAVPADEIFDETTITRIVAGAANGWDVYAGVGLQQQNPGPGRRGTAATVLAMPSVFMDIDIAGPNHKEQRLPLTTDDALEFVAGLPLKPTLLVHSGGGLQAHWGFKELQVIETEDDREIATLLSRAIQEFMIDRGRELGWRFDNTSDLARVLRIAGTLNHKSTPPSPVRILDLTDARYTPADLLPMCAVQKAPPSAQDAPRIDPRTEKGHAPDETRIRAYLSHPDVGGWQPGNRDNAAMKIAVFCRRQIGLSQDETLAWLRTLNNECSSPLPDAVLIDKAGRAGRAA
jgi:hypothetical protein